MTKKNVLVTGSSGFIGKNLCSCLEQSKDFVIFKFDKENDEKELSRLLEKVDFIFHLAGINRPKKDSEFEENRTLTEKILKILKEQSKKTSLLFASSIQAEKKNGYGISKKQTEQVIQNWASETKNPVYIYRLPNVFGKWCRPNYNSVIATFCHNVANDLEIKISDPKIELNLAYIDDVVEEFIFALNGKANLKEDGFCYIKRTFKIKLGSLAKEIKKFSDNRKTFLLSDMNNVFTRFLYATYVSYLPEEKFNYSLTMKTDERGWLAEFIKSSTFGQVFISKTLPGVTRGNHWHHTKVEKFLVISGEAEIKFRKIGERRAISYKVSDKKLEVIDVPPGYTHLIKNTGKKNLLTLFWADELFNAAEPDTYYEQVEKK